MFEDVKIKRKKVKHIGPCNLAMELWLTVLSSFPRDLRPARILRNVPSRFRASGKKKKKRERKRCWYEDFRDHRCVLARVSFDTVLNLIRATSWSSLFFSVSFPSLFFLPSYPRLSLANCQFLSRSGRSQAENKRENHVYMDGLT